jgi:hypothetical protein
MQLDIGIRALSEKLVVAALSTVELKFDLYLACHHKQLAL